MKKTFPLWVVILAGAVGFIACSFGLVDKVKDLFNKPSTK